MPPETVRALLLVVAVVSPLAFATTAAAQVSPADSSAASATLASDAGAPLADADAGAPLDGGLGDAARSDGAPASLDGEPPADEPASARERARQHFQTGVVDFTNGDYAAAIEEFDLGKKNAPLPEFDFNLARAYERLGDAVRALDYYRRYLDQRPHAEDRAQIDGSIAVLEHTVGRVKLASRVPGAVITIDGQPVDPRTPIVVKAGPHLIAASADGFLPRSVVQPVAAGAVVSLSIDPTPPPSPGALRTITLAPTVTVVRAPPSRWPLYLGLAGAVLAVGGVAVAIGIAVSPAAAPTCMDAQSCYMRPFE